MPVYMRDAEIVQKLAASIQEPLHHTSYVWIIETASVMGFPASIRSIRPGQNQQVMSIASINNFKKTSHRISKPYGRESQDLILICQPHPEAVTA